MAKNFCNYMKSLFSNLEVYGVPSISKLIPHIPTVYIHTCHAHFQNPKCWERATCEISQKGINYAKDNGKLFQKLGFNRGRLDELC